MATNGSNRGNSRSNGSNRVQSDQIEAKDTQMSETMTERLMFPLTATMKDELGKYAAEHGESIANVIRAAISQYIGCENPKTHQNRKYRDEAERIAAQRDRNKQKRALVRELLQKYNETH
jgi:class 3 adenylate cyclase